MADFEQYDDNSIKAAYEINSKYWVQIVRAGLDRFQQELTDPALMTAIGDFTDLRILDAGCGEGSFTLAISRRGAGAVFGIDNCQPLITAAQRAVEPDAPVTFWHADVDNIPLPDDAVDLVVCNRLPHALANPDRRYLEFARILRKGGRLIALSQHPCFYGNRQERTSSRSCVSETSTVVDYFGVRVIEQHFNVAGEISPAASVQPIYSLSEYISMLSRAGFVVNEITEPHPDDQLWQDPWWQKNFTRPLFLMVVCSLAK